MMMILMVVIAMVVIVMVVIVMVVISMVVIVMAVIVMHGGSWCSALSTVQLHVSLEHMPILIRW